jgi:hypothetical protein
LPFTTEDALQNQFKEFPALCLFFVGQYYLRADMGYREGYNKKVVRNCRTCGQKPHEMFYARLHMGIDQFYVCQKHIPIPKEKYAVVEIDNRPGKLK